MEMFFTIIFLYIIFETMKILLKKQEKKNKYKGYIKMETITATEIGKYFNKTSREINNLFYEINWIEKNEKGWKITNEGKRNGGIQKIFKGRLSVVWKKDITINKILIDKFNEIKLKEIRKENKNEKKDDFRKKYKAEYRTNTGHFVRSRAEVIIANWLFSEYIAFAYEKRVPIEEDMYCDFYIPKKKIYIEFWGYEDDERYKNRKEKKKEIYKKYNLNLIEIDNEMINNIDDFLPTELLRFGLKI